MDQVFKAVFDIAQLVRQDFIDGLRPSIFVTLSGQGVFVYFLSESLQQLGLLRLGK